MQAAVRWVIGLGERRRCKAKRPHNSDENEFGFIDHGVPPDVHRQTKGTAPCRGVHDYDFFTHRVIQIDLLDHTDQKNLTGMLLKARGVRHPPNFLFRERRRDVENDGRHENHAVLRQRLLAKYQQQ
jgi:hypothetical protein